MTPYSQAIGKWDVTIEAYTPRLICIDPKELEAMEKELKELRAWKDAAIKSSSWNVKHEGKPYTWTNHTAHGQSTTQDPDTSREYNALLPLMELRQALLSGETIINNRGDSVWLEDTPMWMGYVMKFTRDGQDKYQRWEGWENMASIMSTSTGWRIKPTDDYSLLLAELGLGRTLVSEDGAQIRKSHLSSKAAYSPNGEDSLRFVLWYQVVETVLKKHNGWKVVNS